MTLTLLDAVAQSTASAERKVLGDKKLFTLVYVGDSEPRPASDDEAEALGKVLAGELVLPPVRACSKENPAMPAGQSRAEPSVTPHTVRPAGPCMHCGVPGARLLANLNSQETTGRLHAWPGTLSCMCWSSYAAQSRTNSVCPCKSRICI